MSASKNIRVGVIGAGIMGVNHIRSFQTGAIPGAELTAISDMIPANLEPWENVAKFADAHDLIHSGKVDAVVIVTPHFSHAPLSIASFKAGLHVMVEKPLTVRKSDAELILEEHKKSKNIFGIMLNLRTDPLYIHIHGMIQSGALGPIQRIQWTITDWFRPEAYYKAGSWRGTWKGEGGGILVNQAPHQLDLWQWFFGMPGRVRAVGKLGRHHDIEVDDDVTAIFEYPGGTNGVFVATTGEAPGVNRLEIAGDKGLVVVEGRVVKFIRNKTPVSEFNRTTRNLWNPPETEEQVWEFKDSGAKHVIILQNFIDAIAKGSPLIAPGEEGIRSLELANAMTVSMIKEKPVDLPMQSAEYSALLEELIGRSKK